MTWAGGLLLLLVPLSCKSPEGPPDLRTDQSLYRSPGYRSKQTGDLAIYIAPLKDARARTLPAVEGMFPIRYMGERVWARGVREMIGEILRDELKDSAVFADVLPRADDAHLVVIPSLTAAHAGKMESIEGPLTLASCGLRLEIHGPVDAQGQRQVLIDHTWLRTLRSGDSIRPPKGTTALGACLGRTISALLEDLDTSNVSRLGVPVQLPDRSGGRDGG